MQKRFWTKGKQQNATGMRTDGPIPLNGLLPFEAFRERLSESLRLAGESGGMLGVMVLNVGRTTTVNGLFGFQEGDRLIAHVGQQLAAYAGKGRPVCRMYGDEFAVLLPDLDGYSQLLGFAHEVSTALRQSLRIGSHDWAVTASTGISLYPYDGSTVDELLYRAGIALRHAKEKGGNRQQIYHPEMPEISLHDLQTETALRQAFEEGQLMLHYQPAVRLSDGDLSGVEALLRWNKPGRGFLPPAEFISVAERCGLIVPIGAWALKEACRQHRLWKLGGLGTVPVSVNVSASQLYQPDFVRQVVQALEESGMEPRFLTLEITESEAMKHSRFMQQTIHLLKKIGVRLAIDNYGTGYTSVGHLQRFRVDIIKIDNAYVREAVQNRTVQSLLRALIELSHSLKLEIVAEGVETTIQAGLLRELGCDYAQGFRYYPPMPPNRCDAVLRDSYRRPASYA